VTTERREGTELIRLRFRVVRPFRGHLRMATWEPLGLAADFVGEVDGFLVDEEFLEGERHEPGPRFRE